jgi:hypothetical protein
MGDSLDVRKFNVLFSATVNVFLFATAPSPTTNLTLPATWGVLEAVKIR